MPRWRRIIFPFVTLCAAWTAIGFVIVGVWALGDRINRRGIPMPSRQLDPGHTGFFELTAYWQSLDIRGAYVMTGQAMSGYVIWVPDRSVSLWPVFIVSVLILWWCYRSKGIRKRAVDRGFRVITNEAKNRNDSSLRRE